MHIQYFKITNLMLGNDKKFNFNSIRVIMIQGHSQNFFQNGILLYNLRILFIKCTECLITKKKE